MAPSGGPGGDPGPRLRGPARSAAGRTRAARRAASGGSARAGQTATWAGRAKLIPVLLGEDAEAVADALLDALRSGATEEDIAGAVAHAAALRIAQFPTSNEFGDWDTALHTFTFANAVQQGLARSPSVDLLRGVFDAAMSVYLDRFLNVPPVRLPQPDGASRDRAAGHRGGEMLNELTALLDRQQQVNEAGRLVADYLYGGGDPDRLIATLGRALLREDRNFHTIQNDRGGDAAVYWAARLTRRRPGSWWRKRAIWPRLQRGEKLFEDE